MSQDSFVGMQIAIGNYHSNKQNLEGSYDVIVVQSQLCPSYVRIQYYACSTLSSIVYSHPNNSNPQRMEIFGRCNKSQSTRALNASSDQMPHNISLSTQTHSIGQEIGGHWEHGLSYSKGPCNQSQGSYNTSRSVVAIISLLLIIGTTLPVGSPLSLVQEFIRFLCANAELKQEKLRHPLS